jgi:hypothetical protein
MMVGVDTGDEGVQTTLPPVIGAGVPMAPIAKRVPPVTDHEMLVRDAAAALPPGADRLRQAAISTNAWRQGFFIVQGSTVPAPQRIPADLDG